MIALTGFVVAWKDSESFTHPFTEYGVIQVFPNVHRARAAMEKYKVEIDNMLYPKVVHSREPLFNFKRKDAVRQALEQLPEYRRQELIQQKRTMFVDEVKLA